jgi:putative spermidine/putrescine transport system permease protein
VEPALAARSDCGGHALTSSRLLGWALCLPALGLVALCFGWPLWALARISLMPSEGGVLREGWTTQAYRSIATDDFIHAITLDSIGLAATCAAAATVIAYPIALFLFRTRHRFRAALTVIAIAPLLVSGTARIIGWLALLSDDGLVNGVLAATGIGATALINNWTGVRIGLTESLLPYAILALIAGFGRLDPRLEQAAASLGARPLPAFLRITLPLSLPAVSLAFLLAFVLGMSAFITPRLMGGGRVFTLATEIYDAATETLEWPTAAALSVYALALMLLVLAAHGALSRRVAPR